MRWSLVAVLLLFGASPLLAREGPNNIIFVTAATQGNAGGLYPCTALDVPYGCCTGMDAGTCDVEVNGGDICQALEDCEDVGGCRLQLPEGIIEEAEHVITGTRGWVMSGTTPCGANFGTAPDAGFPNGLIVQGKGVDRTILRATVPARFNGDNFSLITVAANNGLTGAELPKLVYQNLSADGRRGLQPTSVTLQEIFSGTLDLVDSVTDDALPSVKIRNVHFFGSMSSTIHVGTFAQTILGVPTAPDHPIIYGELHVLNSFIDGGGCVQPHSVGTGSPGVLPCGCDRADAGGNCAGFNDLADINAGQPGWKRQGNSITVGWPSNILLAYNHFTNGAHYGVGSESGLDPLCAVVSPLAVDDFSPGACGTGWHIHRNRFELMGSSAIDAHGAYVTRITENTFLGNCFDDNWGTDDCSNISFASTWQRWVYMRGNNYTSSGTRGVGINFYHPLDGESDSHQDWPDVWLENETYELKCNLCANPNQECFALWFDPGKNENLSGTYDGDLDGVVMRNLTFTDNVVGNNCAGSIIASQLERETATRDSLRNVTVDGGSWRFGGANVSSDGWGLTGTAAENPVIAYFNYVTNLHVCGSATPSNPNCTPSNPLTIVGNGAGDGVLTFGGNTGPPNHQFLTGCFDTITTSAGATVNNRASLTTPCP